MADVVDDLEYSETNIGSAQAQGVRKNISLKLKGKGRGRGRRGGRARRGPAKKIVPETPVNEEEEEEVETPEPPPDNIPAENKFSSSVSLDEVISKLEAPSFSPMDRGFPEPLHQNKKLRWDHKVNLIGEKVINPMIHCCEKCSLPILNYGRMIPCKHVFCYDCAKKADKSCPKCEDKVQRVEQSPLGTVFMCTYGGTRHVPGSCGRTYLSQRDLQAHVNHRHVKPLVTSGTSTAQVPVQTNTVQAPSVTTGATHLAVARDPRDPRAHMVVDTSHSAPSVSMIGHVSHPHMPQEHRDQVDHTRNSTMQPPAMQGSPAGQPRQYPHPPASYPSAVPVSSARPNLITVPIQDDSAAATSQHVHVQSHPPQYTTPGSQAHALPPHQQHPPTAYVPPPHPYPHPHMAPVSAYSQTPSMTTQTFTQPPPPVHHPPPPIRAPNPPAPMYSTPPPPPVHHPPPTTYTTPPVAQHSSHTLPPPQRFTSSTTYEESPSYIQPWGSSGVPPPPARAPLPPRPIAAPPPQSTQSMGLLPAPSEPAYRPPYYQ